MCKLMQYQYIILCLPTSLFTQVGYVDNKYVSIPVNIDTVNLLFKEQIRSSKEMGSWLKAEQVNFATLENSNQACLSRFGQCLCEKLFTPYTLKQWEKHPDELNLSALWRIPVLKNYDDRYFPNDQYQALPKEGYTNFVKNMLLEKRISVKLETNFFNFRDSKEFRHSSFEKIIYTGKRLHSLVNDK